MRGLFRSRLARLAALATLSFVSSASAVEPTSPAIRAETAYFLAVGQDGPNGPESFVVPVSGAARISEIRQYLAERAAGTEKRPLIPTCVVRLGADGVNRNHSGAGAPEWGWHVAEYVSSRRAQPELELYMAIPAVFANPSEIEPLLRDDPAGFPDNQIYLLNYPIAMELRHEFPVAITKDVVRPTALANVSDRGYVGPGNQVKITGFVIEGDTPRNVLIRVLGPSLAAFDVPGTLANPQFEVYRGGEKIAENNDWVDGNLNRPVIAVYPPPSPFHLVPHDQKEPALELTLTPGAYTIIVSGVDGSSGIVLTEVYTL